MLQFWEVFGYSVLYSETFFIFKLPNVLACKSVIIATEVFLTIYKITSKAKKK